MGVVHVLGAIGALGLSYAFAVNVLDIPWDAAPLTALAGIAATAVVVAAVGVGASWDVLRRKPLAVLRAGATSEEFWPAMHACEALTYAGRGEEVLAALARRTAVDDQQLVGLAREAVRAGDRSQISALLAILVKPGSIGHTHAAESLFKVCEVGDGSSLRAFDTDRFRDRPRGVVTAG